ncbi:DUF6214 family protein, partial [Streptomyces hirsutus]|uniref:DUF6214 family protein n=1 Tax=Streptomyces hirsutus TaxID=35620 RepID=UPI003668866F
MSVWPAWEVREGGHATRWFHVRLDFADGAGVEALALVSGLCVCVEDVRARPALSLEDLALFADWIEGPRPPGGGAPAARTPPPTPRLVVVDPCLAAGRPAAEGDVQ